MENTEVKVQKNPVVTKNASEIVIPDLWAIAEQIANGTDFSRSPEFAKAASEAILETWHLAHFLKIHIIDN
jgi:hypothetical protein